MARGKGSSTGLNDPFWVGPCELCGFYFWLSMSNVITNVLQEKEKSEGGGEVVEGWVLDMGIFPLCGLSYPLPEVPGSGTNGDPSHSSS